ncbi:MAG: hypothetical protein OXH02_11150 [Gemmatimonadetes bacterium]|nr:hypothetical protein [Gemmatimonadota bacterium]
MAMKADPDFSALLALLNAHRVEYMIVGGHALALHGSPRFTGDLDIYYKADAVNAERMTAVIAEFGFGDLGLTADDFLTAESVLQLGVPPRRLDFLNSLTGVSWNEAYTGRVKGTYGDIQVHYIGRDQLIKNKRATGRQRDLADLEMLEGI